MTEDKLVLLDIKDHIATITINRPRALNALNPQVLEQMEAAVVEAGKNDDVRVLILTGTGKAFVAGADIVHMVEMTPEQGMEFGQLGHRVLGTLESLPQPVIAAVNGFAFGGGLELALACDLIYASSRAKLGLPEVSLAIIPGYGGTQRLPRRIGPGLAKEVIYTGNHYTAQHAYELGIVNAVFEAEEFMDKVLEVARTIASRGPLAIAAAKRAVNQGIELTLLGGLQKEAEQFTELFGSEDQREGMRAFMEKRAPVFKGR